VRDASRLLFSVLLGAMVLGASAASAGTKPAPHATALGQGPAISGAFVGPTTAQSTCTLGVTGAPAFIVDYLYPPNDAYYTLLDPASCTACSAPAVNAVAAHVVLNFRGACALPVSVGIYGATGDVACYTPDPNNVLCTPFTVSLAPTAAGNYDFSIPFPNGCCISQPAFLKIEFLAFTPGCDAATSWPKLITTSDCSMACSSWNIYPGGTGPDDLCMTVGFPGQPVMRLDVDCCNITPTAKHSWGNLKSIYR
jgi:hypothetical protein